MNKSAELRAFILGMACAAGACLTTSVHARKIKTKHSIPKQAAAQYADSDFPKSTISIETDSIYFCSRVNPAIRFYGFDKTATGTQESFFVSNGLDRPISEMELQITYLDMKGRQLHRRNVRLECDIPGGETKRIDIKSWDSQKSFYYHKSIKPKRQATPFRVRIELISATLHG